jgi:hypothetical protein
LAGVLIGFPLIRFSAESFEVACPTNQMLPAVKSTIKVPANQKCITAITTVI